MSSRISLAYCAGLHIWQDCMDDKIYVEAGNSTEPAELSVAELLEVRDQLVVGCQRLTQELPK